MLCLTRLLLWNSLQQPTPFCLWKICVCTYDVHRTLTNKRDNNQSYKKKLPLWDPNLGPAAPSRTVQVQNLWYFLFLYGEVSCEIYENLHWSKIFLPYGIPKTTLSKIPKNHAQYECMDLAPSRKKFCSGKHSNVDRGLLIWMRQALAMVTVNDPLLKQRRTTWCEAWA